jgi:hypothetical protein
VPEAGFCSLIRERTGAGRKEAMSRGVKFGRPPKLSAEQMALITRCLPPTAGDRDRAAARVRTWRVGLATHFAAAPFPPHSLGWVDNSNHPLSPWIDVYVSDLDVVITATFEVPTAILAQTEQPLLLLDLRDSCSTPGSSPPRSGNPRRPRRPAVFLRIMCHRRFHPKGVFPLLPVTDAHYVIVFSCLEIGRQSKLKRRSRSCGVGAVATGALPTVGRRTRARRGAKLLQQLWKS